MASLIDSTAQFEQRGKDVGLSVAALGRLQRAGIVALGVLAYSHGQPGQAISDDAFSNWVRNNIDNAMSLGDQAMIKRLLFEAHMLVLASLKEQVTTPDAAAHRKVPPSERESKMSNIKTTLVGLNLEAANEPGHTLLDACAQMFHLNEIRYVPPEKCVSRLHEVTHAKQPSKQIELEADKLVIKEKQEVPTETASSALQVKEALERRGIGLVFADLVSHASYTKYLSSLFGHLHREPPPGYSRCSVGQLVNADKTVWARMLEEGIRPKRAADGTLPLDTALSRALESYQVSFALLPLPAAKKVEKPPKPPKIRTQFWAKPGKGKGGGKSKSGKGQKLPFGIVKLGGVGRTPDGKNLCFKYNLESCSEASDGAACTKGEHLCAKCFGAHPISEHNKH